MSTEVVLNLNLQTRDRNLCSYQQDLALPDIANLTDKQILLIGGGDGVYSWAKEIKADFINYDLYISGLADDTVVKSIQGDFTLSAPQYDVFDEIWALFSLPTYCRSISAVDLFFAKSITALKPGGTFRVAPIEPFGITKSMMRRETPTDFFIQRFYENMQDYSTVGGNAKTIWYGTDIDNDTWTDYNKENKLSKKYPGITFEYTTECYEPCAIIGKPKMHATKINDIMKQKIATATAWMQQQSTLLRVYANSEELCY